jgi:glycerol uptake facilitator-like aquaporin
LISLVIYCMVMVIVRALAFGTRTFILAWAKYSECAGFIGTFYLCFSVALAKSQFAPLCIGPTLVVVVYMGGAISGAHFNPAVTLAVAFNEMLFMPGAPSRWAQITDRGQRAFVKEFLEANVSKLRERLITEWDKMKVHADWEQMKKDLNKQFNDNFIPVGEQTADPQFTEKQIIDIHDYLAPHDWGYKFAFWIFQLLGAICAGLTARHCTLDFQANLQANFPAPGSAGRGDVVFEVFVEIIATAALCWVVLGTAVAKDAEAKHYYGFAIGMTVFFMAAAVGSISGGAFNPAVGTGLQVVNLSGNKAFIWIYWAGPLAGAILGTLLFRLTHKSGKEHPKYD